MEETKIPIRIKNELYHRNTKPFFTGGQGNIYFAERTVSRQKQVVVIKEYKDPKILMQDWKLFQMIGNECDNIVKVIDKIDEKYLVYEFCNCGDLYTYFIKERDPITTKKELFEAVSICLQIAKAINLLQSKGYSHRDIKPENILLHQDIKNDILMVKLADLGFCKQSNQLRSFVGTPNYIAPEIIYTGFQQKDEMYTSAVDVWSFGVLMYEMITKKQIFKGKTPLEVFNSVQSFQQKENIDVVNTSVEESGRFNRLIRDCLQINPQNRINFEQIQEELTIIERSLSQSQSVMNNSSFQMMDISQINFSRLISQNIIENQAYLNINEQQPNNKKEQVTQIANILEVNEASLKVIEPSTMEQNTSQLAIPNSSDASLEKSDKSTIEKSSSQSDTRSSLNKEIQGNFIQNELILNEYQNKLNLSVPFDFKSISTHYISKVAENLYQYATSGQFTSKILDIDVSQFSGIIASDDLERSLSPLLLHKMLQNPREQFLLRLQSYISTQKEDATYAVVQQNKQKYTKTFIQVACLKVLQDLIDITQQQDYEGQMNNKKLIHIVQNMFSNECSGQAIFWCFENYFAVQLSKLKDLQSLIEKEDSISLSCGINLKGCKDMPHDIKLSQEDQQNTLFICKSFCSKKKYNILIPSYLMDQLFSSQTPL